jgi:arabinogalactan oligomer / maltooligosaccharide transport system permease protein
MAPNILETKAARRSSGSITLSTVVLRLIAIILFWIGGSWLMINMWLDGYWPLALTVLVITLLVSIVWLRPESYPMRWMSPGLALMILVSVYPIVYTFYLSFTNYGTGHIVPKVQAIEVLESRRYLPENASEYDFTLYRNPFGEYAVLLQTPADSDAEPIVVVPQQTIDDFSAEELILESIDTENLVIVGEDSPYTRVPRNQMLTAIAELRGITFGTGEYAVQLEGLTRAAATEQQYVYDEESNAILDRKNDAIYFADDERGRFISADGTVLSPGYAVGVGLSNYMRFLTNPSFRGPLAAIFIWTVLYASISVLLSFGLGLLIAIAFSRNMPAKGLVKTLLIVPFAIPNVITILIWRGLLNPINGLYGTMLSSLAGEPVNVFADPFLVKTALIAIQVWLSYPYFYLISSGALQAIPLDMYEAADLDGSNAWQQFRFITLPLLMVSVGPLLIGSFMYTFNSFNLIFLFNSGGPPMVGTPTPAGHSDILISYVYRLAFESGGQDYGYATAITVIIFFILLGITLLQYRYMNVVEKVGENV